jgi:hypothetical protein
VTREPESRSRVFLVALLLAGAASLLLLLASLRVVQRRVSRVDGRASATVSAETGVTAVARRVRGEEGPELVRAAGFSPDRGDGPWLKSAADNGTSAEVAPPRLVGTSCEGGSDLAWVNQTGFVTESWRITSVVRSPHEGEDRGLRADLQLGPVPIDVARLPEPD